MAEPVSELIIAIRADISQLKTELEKAKGETRKWGRANIQETRNLQLSIKKLKEPISNVSQLANGLGTAFGGAASKATGLVNGIVSSFAAGGAVGIAIGATTGLVSILVDRFGDARKAAEEAQKAARDEQLTRAQDVKEQIAVVDAAIADAKGKLGRGPDVIQQVQDALAHKESQAIEDVAAAREKVATAQKNYDDALKHSNAFGRAARLEEKRTAEEQLRRAEIALDTAKDGNAALKDRLGLLGDLRTELANTKPPVGSGRGGGKASAAAPGVPPGPTGDPFATRESTAAYLKAAVADAQRREDFAAIEKAGKVKPERALKDTAEATRELTEETKALQAVAQTTGDVFSSQFINPLVEGTFKIEEALLGIGKELAKLAAQAALRLFLTAITGGPGGLIPSLFAEGGSVGARGTDTVPSLLTPGEFVMPVEAVRSFGLDFMENVRKIGRYGSGGLIGGAASNSAVTMGGINVTINGAASPSIIRQLKHELITQRDSTARALAQVLQKQTGLNPSRT